MMQRIGWDIEIPGERGTFGGAPGDLRVDDCEAARLVARFQAGDTQAFGALYSAYFDRVYGYLRLLMRNRHDAEDVTQQVFAQVYQALPAYRHRHSFWVWLLVVARNQGLKELRKLGRLEVEDPGEVGGRLESGETSNSADIDVPVSESAAEIDPLKWVSDADILVFVERLPLPQRQVLALRYMLDLKHAQIAQILSRTPGDIDVIHHRAVTYLRKRLAVVGRKSSRDPGTTRPASWQRRPSQMAILRARRFSLDKRL